MSEKQLRINDKQTYDNSALKLILICVALYAISYLGRKSYDSNINEIMSFYGIDKGAAGLVGTCFFITYALGQVFHGIMCKYYNPKIVVFIALVVCGLCNFVMGIMPSSGFVFLKYVWIINGFASAALWSLLIMLLNKVLAAKHIKQALFAMCFPVSIGVFIVYIVSALCSSLNAFKWTFYFAAILITAIAFYWIFSYKSLVGKCIKEKEDLDGVAVNLSEKRQKGKRERTKIDFSFVILFGVLALFAIVDNFVKDGITTWTPTILKEKYALDNSVSVLLTIMLPLFAVIGSTFATVLNKKIDNYVSLCGVYFAVAAAILGILILCLGLNTWVITLVCFMLLSAGMSGVNNILTNIFPLKSKGVNAGFVAGLIDGFCYLGSAASSFGLGFIAQGTGNWDGIMYLFLGLCLLCVILVFAYNAIKKFKRKKI